MEQNLMISGLSVSVRHEPLDGGPDGFLFGMWSQGPMPSITVNSSCSEAIKARTLLHEVLEAINDLNGIGLQEEQICALESNLADTFGRNRTFFQEWLANL